MVAAIKVAHCGCSRFSRVSAVSAVSAMSAMSATLSTTVLLVQLQLMVLVAVMGKALPGAATDHRTEHPGLTQAILSSHFLEDDFIAENQPVAAQSEEQLQQDDTVPSRHKRNAENTTNEPQVTISDGDKDYDDSDDTVLDTKETSNEDVAGMSQHFFPSFTPLFPPVPPLGHSRPPLLFQEPAHSQRPALLRPQHNSFQPIGFSAAKFLQTPSAAPEGNTGSSILGSGNFGVIRGGTFYNDDEHAEINEFGSGESHHVFSPFYQNNNGHGRPTFFNGASNPRPQHHGNDFFANFRDFAEINTPTKSSFSEYYVVYVNKNASNHEPHMLILGERPKNIIEQLTLIDNEETTKLPQDKQTILKKTSLGKAKLARLHQAKSNNKQRSRKSNSTSAKDLHEPLLALS